MSKSTKIHPTNWGNKSGRKPKCTNVSSNKRPHASNRCCRANYTKPLINPPENGGPYSGTSDPTPNGKTRANMLPLVTSQTFSANSIIPRMKTTQINNTPMSFPVRNTSTTMAHPRLGRISSAKPLSHQRKFPWASKTSPWEKLLALIIYPMRCSN